MANLHPFRTFNADNFGGAYTYASLAAFEAQQPELFTITTDNPLTTFQQNDYAWFAQYERKIGSASLFAGVRHEFQSGMTRYGNLAPRLAIAFAPGKEHRTVIRAGAGVFYDRRPPQMLEQALRYNGIQTQQYLLAKPSNEVAESFGAEWYSPRPPRLQTALIAQDDSGFRSCLLVALVSPFEVANQLLSLTDIVARQIPRFHQLGHDG